jgi:RNA polymerase sigma-70 factor (ECF subfamily)
MSLKIPRSAKGSFGSSASERTGDKTLRDPSSFAVAEDQELVAGLRAREEAAFRTVVERYHGALLRLARTFVSDNAVAEEVVQETWLGVINGLPGFEGRSSLKTWIFRILINRAQTRGKREARSRPFSSLWDVDVGEPEAAVDPGRFTARGMWVEPPPRWSNAPPEELLMQRETMELIQRAITELPENQRMVITLHDVEGVAPDEICNILEISETNQRVLLHRARSKIRGALEQYLKKR